MFSMYGTTVSPDSFIFPHKSENKKFFVVFIRLHTKNSIKSKKFKKINIYFKTLNFANIITIYFPHRFIKLTDCVKQQILLQV